MRRKRNRQRDYARIDSPEALELAKWRTLQDMGECSQRIRKGVARMASPSQVVPWLPADLPIVRYATYAVAAYRSYKTVRQILSHFRWGRKR